MGDKTIDAKRMAFATGLTLCIIFAVCWVGTMIDIPASHKFVELFTAFPTASWAALGQGVIAALLGGGIGGFLWASLYNMLSSRRT